LAVQELEIMKIVSDRGCAPVRDVHVALLERRKIAYTTVMTMMNVLELKKHLRKLAEDRACIYRPTKHKKQVIKGKGRGVVARF
jgi:predicted transcriptional regulator